MASEVGAKGLLLFFGVRWKPGSAGILTLQEVWDEDLVLVRAFATISEEISALIRWISESTLSRQANE